MVEVEFAIDLSPARQASVAPSLIHAPARQLFVVAIATAPSLAARAKEMDRQGYIKGNEIMAKLTSNSCASKKMAYSTKPQSPAMDARQLEMDARQSPPRAAKSAGETGDNGSGSKGISGAANKIINQLSEILFDLYDDVE